MTGEQFYKAHRASAIDFGIDVPPVWEALTPREQSLWDNLAFEQDLRDRDFHAKLYGRKGGPSYDGPYAD